MQIQIGSLICAELRKQGHTNAWLAERIGVSERTLQRIFKQSSIDTQKLMLVCLALEVDMFRFYSELLSDTTILTPDNIVMQRGKKR
ncbi:MAG: helix-turn-helix domain-containing protein [Bacteroidales bacterium]|nr:helix-turn-helix domain-containing protein [Bacteroidales bacterium]